MLLYACSSNHGKLAEFALAAETAGDGIEIRPLPGLQAIAPPDETGASFAQNAASKALYYSRFTPDAVFADDSGLEVDALAGAPGIYSARYAGPDATDSSNLDLLLEQLRLRSNRKARFVCEIAMAKGGRLLLTAGGTVDGEIAQEPQGRNGFGYDPVFFYPALGCTFAQLTAEAKFAVSHRGNAARVFIAKLRET